MESIFVTLNKIQTHLITWGNPFDCNNDKDVIICISGNPGLPNFYIEFGSELHKNTGLPVCVIGQAGHEYVPDHFSNKIQNQEYLFNLEGQLKHKLDLISKFNKQSKLHLIGHSIGAWLVTELIQANSHLLRRISSINLLFPTLQRMSETRNGFVLNKITRRIHVILMLLVNVIYFMPKFIKIFLINLYLKFHSLPNNYTDRILQFLNPKVIEKVLFLAYDEMDRVRLLNTEAINIIKHKTFVTYGVSDGWAPLHFMDDLKQFLPDNRLQKVNIDHSFVLKSSEQVACIVSENIKASQICN